MSIYKHKCSCGESWFSDEENEYDCDYANPDDEDEEANHIVSRVKRLTADDYATVWSEELENANRHDSTEMPQEIFEILNKNIKDKKVVRKIMKELYEKEIGI